MRGGKGVAAMSDWGLVTELVLGMGLMLVLIVAVVTFTFLGIRCAMRHGYEPW